MMKNKTEIGIGGGVRRHSEGGTWHSDINYICLFENIRKQHADWFQTIDKAPPCSVFCKHKNPENHAAGCCILFYIQFKSGFHIIHEIHSIEEYLQQPYA